MRSREEWVSDQNRLLADLEAVRGEVLRIPGVVEVNVGRPRRGGDLLEELVYVIRVRGKLPEEALAPHEILPRTIRGVPTDVQLHREREPLIGFDDENNKKKYRPLVGGCRIRVEYGSGGSATLGCFCRAENGDTVILSNHHVLLGGLAEEGSEITQPKSKGCWCCRKGQIGETIMGFENLDCAIALLYPDQAFFPKVRRIRRADGTVEEEGLLLGVAAPVQNDRVWKIGAKTGLTRGTIGNVNNQFFSVDVAPPFPRFAARGDSGSMVVHEGTNMVVGLLHSIDKGSDGIVGHATRMDLIETLMKIKLIPSDPNENYPESATVEDELNGSASASPLDHMVALLRQTEGGRELLTLVARHEDECLDIVGRCKKFTIAWHRNNGPAWLAALARSSREPIYRIPTEIGGVDRAVAIERISSALYAEASDSLRRDLTDHGPGLIDALSSADRVEDLLTQVRDGLVRTHAPI